MPVYKEEEQLVTIPFNLGIDNLSLSQTVQPPLLVDSRNTRLSVQPGVCIKSPKVVNIGEFEGDCYGIVSSSAEGAAIAFFHQSPIYLNGDNFTNYKDSGSSSGQTNYNFPLECSNAQILPIGDTYTNPSITYDSANDLYWTLSLKDYGTEYALYLSANRPDGSVYVQATRVASNGATAPAWSAFQFFSLTSSDTNGMVIWYSNGPGVNNKIYAQKFVLDGLIPALSVPVEIYEPVEAGPGQVSVVSTDDVAYLATFHTSTNTTLMVHEVSLASLSATDDATALNTITSGAKLSISYLDSKILVSTSGSGSGPISLLLDTDLNQIWLKSGLALSGLTINRVVNGFIEYQSINYPVTMLVDDLGDFASGTFSGSHVIIHSPSSGASLNTYTLPWMVPVSEMRQIQISGKSQPIIIMTRSYDTNPVPADPEFIDSPSIELYSIGYTNCSPIGRFGVDSVYPEKYSRFCGTNVLTTYNNKCAFSYRIWTTKSDDDVQFSSRYVELEATTHQPRFTTTSEGTTYIAAAMPMIWDGSNLSEPLPIYKPNIYVASSGGTGATLTTGAYLTAAVYSWVDNNGIKYESSPSTVRSVSGAGMKPIISYTPFHTTHDDVRLSKGKIELYSSLVGGTVLYLQTHSDITDGAFYRVYNTFDQPTTGIYNPPIYADGSIALELPNFCPPAAYDCKVVGDRCWILSGEDRQVLWPSKLRVGNSGFGWNSNLKYYLLSSNAGIGVGLSELQGNLMVFTTTGVYTMTGKGPDNTLSGGIFPDLIKLTDYVCTSKESIQDYPNGIIFQSNNQFVKIESGTVQDMNIDASLCGAIVTSVINKKNHEIIFIGENFTYVYNYKYDKWTIWDALPSGIQSACLTKNNQLTVHDGQNFYNIDFSDVAIDANMSWETGDLTFGDATQSEFIIHDILIHGRYLGSHGMEIDIIPDYGQRDTVTKTFTTDDILNSTVNGQYTISVNAGTHSMRALALRIRETDSSGPGAAPVSLSILISKLPASKRDAVLESGRK